MQFKKAASATVSLRRTPMDQQIFLRRGTDVGARQFGGAENAGPENAGPENGGPSRNAASLCS